MQKFALEGSHKLIMGILNVTPDSFSDGGMYEYTDAAVSRAFDMLSEGADIIDIGGESTRPGALLVDEEEEIRRVLPVIKGILDRRKDVIISIDTNKFVVAKAALEAGARIVNDINGLRADKDMAKVVSQYGATVIAMANLRNDATSTPEGYLVQDVLTRIKAQFNESKEIALANEITMDRLILDPGIGFGTTRQEEVYILEHLDELMADESCDLLVGASRKRVISYLCEQETSRKPTKDEIILKSVQVHAKALASRARIVRVHDVALLKNYLA